MRLLELTRLRWLPYRPIHPILEQQPYRSLRWLYREPDPFRSRDLGSMCRGYRPGEDRYPSFTLLPFPGHVEPRQRRGLYQALPSYS